MMYKNKTRNDDDRKTLPYNTETYTTYSME